MSRIKTYRTSNYDAACIACREKLNLGVQFSAEYDFVAKEWLISYPLAERDDLPQTGPKEVT
jgi:hypothetical protein